MATENNMAPGEQNAPENGKTIYRPQQADGEEIIDGARQTDELKKQQDNAAKEPSENNQGASPTKDVLTQQDIQNGIKPYETQTQEHMALETKEGKNNGAIPAAFAGQQSNHP